MRRQFGLLLLLVMAYGVAAGPRPGARFFPKNYFRNPLDVPVLLAGSFGELRTNHFHTGIDIKTNGEEGLPVYAAADGFLSRIGVSGGGYGNVLYLDHPNGYSTVYGHLRRFNDSIQAFTQATQYRTQSFEQDILVDSTRFRFKKGDIIGYSGNTGGSGGPHLHFEIRESQTEKPVNPLLWGYTLKDTIAPTIKGIKVYPLDSDSYVRVYYAGRKMPVTAIFGQNLKLDAGGGSGSYRLRGITAIEGKGRLGFAVSGIDYINESWNTMGVYGIELCVDDEIHYGKSMRSLDFDLKRYINTHVDFAERSRTGQWYEKSYVSPHNSLPIYDELKDRGEVNLQPGQERQVIYYLKDIYANMSVLPFKVSCPAQPLDPRPLIAVTEDTLLPYDQHIAFRRPGLQMDVPPNTFYDLVPFSYDTTPRTPKIYSAVHALGNAGIPVNDYYTLAIKTQGLPDDLKDKACILSYATGYLGGTYENGWMKGRARALGKFYVSADVTAPVVRPVNIRQNSNLSQSKVIAFVIKDDMSGIGSYVGKIDDQWVLFRRDNKTATIWYEFDQYCPPGQHTLELTVTDNRKNVTRQTFTFTR